MFEYITWKNDGLDMAAKSRESPSSGAGDQSIEAILQTLEGVGDALEKARYFVAAAYVAEAVQAIVREQGPRAQ